MRSVLQLAELGPDQFLARLGELAEIYAAAMAPPPAQLPGRRSIMERHAGYRGFRAIAATLPGGYQQAAPRGRGTPVIGFAYGFHGERGQWWHDVVHAALATGQGSETAQAWMSDCFEIAEVHVHPDHQGRGSGRAMMLRLTAGLPERTTVLSTMDADTRARRLYRWLGFIDLLPGFIFPGADLPYSIMGAALPLQG